MQGFVDPNELPELALLNHSVHVGGVVGPQNVAPFLRLAEDPQKFGMGMVFGRLLRLAGGGQHQHHAGEVGLQGKGLHPAGRGQHDAVEILAQAAHAVHDRLPAGAVAHQLRLIRPAHFFKILHGLFPGPMFLFKGKISFGHAAHFRLDLPNLGVGQFALQPDVQPVAHGVQHPHPSAGVQPTGGGQQQKPQGALINAAALLIPIGQAGQLAVRVQGLVQLQTYAPLHNAEGSGRRRLVQQTADHGLHSGIGRKCVGFPIEGYADDGIAGGVWHDIASFRKIGGKR